jgi:hypothetical protein
MVHGGIIAFYAYHGSSAYFKRLWLKHNYGLHDGGPAKNADSTEYEAWNLRTAHSFYSCTTNKLQICKRMLKILVVALLYILACRAIDRCESECSFTTLVAYETSSTSMFGTKSIGGRSCTAALEKCEIFRFEAPSMACSRAKHLPDWAYEKGLVDHGACCTEMAAAVKDRCDHGTAQSPFSS